MPTGYEFMTPCPVFPALYDHRAAHGIIYEEQGQARECRQGNDQIFLARPGQFIFRHYTEFHKNHCRNSGVPYGIRTRVAAVKGQCPRPLDERDKAEGASRGLRQPTQADESPKMRSV